MIGYHVTRDRFSLQAKIKKANKIEAFLNLHDIKMAHINFPA